MSRGVLTGFGAGVGAGIGFMDCRLSFENPNARLASMRLPRIDSFRSLTSAAPAAAAPPALQPHSQAESNTSEAPATAHDAADEAHSDKPKH